MDVLEQNLAKQMIAGSGDAEPCSLTGRLRVLARDVSAQIDTQGSLAGGASSRIGWHAACVASVSVRGGRQGVRRIAGVTIACSTADSDVERDRSVRRSSRGASVRHQQPGDDDRPLLCAHPRPRRSRDLHHAARRAGCARRGQGARRDRRADRCRSMAYRSPSRTISTSRACRRRRPARPSPTRRRSDATCVERLARAGAIVIGKTNLDQFATGLVGVRSPYGVARNAFDPALIPGGSSSGLRHRRRRPGSCRSRSAPTPPAPAACRPG